MNGRGFCEPNITINPGTGIPARSIGRGVEADCDYIFTTDFYIPCGARPRTRCNRTASRHGMAVDGNFWFIWRHRYREKLCLRPVAGISSKCFRYQTGPQYLSFAVSPAYSCFTGPSIAQSWGRFSCRQSLSERHRRVREIALSKSPVVIERNSLARYVAASPKQGATKRSNGAQNFEDQRGSRHTGDFKQLAMATQTRSHFWQVICQKK